MAKKQTTLKKFLKFEKPEQYDFKCEMPKYYEDYKGNWKYSLRYEGMLKILQEEQDTFCMEGNSTRRYQLYRILSGCGKDFDSDNSNGTCHLVYEIYQNLWCVDDNPKEDKKFQLSRLGFVGHWGGDTMNSFDTIYSDIMKIIASSIHKNPNVARLAHKLKYDYTSTYTTLGNFVLVPYGFNGGRYDETKDYWDASLYKLKNTGYGKFTPNDFNRYINLFFLWDYVKKPKGENPESKYDIIELFNRKALSEGGYMTANKNTEKDAGKFLDNTIKRIKRRGIFMVEMLWLSQNKKKDFDEIMDYLSKSDVLFESIYDALECITSTLDLNRLKTAKKRISDIPL